MDTISISSNETTVGKILKVIGMQIGIVISVWVIALYIHLLYCVNILGLTGRNVILLFLLFLPVLPMELLGTAFFNGNVKELIPQSKKAKRGLSARLLFWFFCYIFWVILVPLKMSTTIGLKIFTLISILFLMEGKVAYVFLGILVIFYYTFVYKLRIFRVFICLALPAIFSLLMVFQFNFYGGEGNYSKKEIERQPGVSVFFDEDSWQIIPGLDFDKEIKDMWVTLASKHPRGIYYDSSENALFAVYSNTYYLGGKAYPNILKINVLSQTLDYALLGGVVRHLSLHGPTIIAAPWGSHYLYELSKKDLKIVRQIPIGVDLMKRWQPMDIYHDVQAKSIYLSTSVMPVLVKYDYKTGKVLNYKILLEQHGPVAWNILVSQTTGKIYCIAGAVVFEVDPVKYNVLRSLAFNDLMCSALTIDENRQLLYCQSGGLDDSIYEISLKDFTIIRKLKGAIHSRNLCLDKERNCIYILSYAYGKLIALDLKSGKHLWESKVGGKPDGLSKSGNILWVNSRTGIIKMDLETIWEAERKKL